MFIDWSLDKILPQAIPPIRTEQVLQEGGWLRQTLPKCTFAADARIIRRFERNTYNVQTSR
jgi:hypothetical protein